MKELYENMSVSERRSLLIGGVALGLILIYGIIWLPLQRGVVSLEESVIKNQTLVTWMQNASADVRVLLGSAPAIRTERGDSSLLALVDSTARQSNLGTSVRRVEPKGKDEVRVRLEAAAFDDMIRWLTELQLRYGIQTESVSVDKQPNPGRINANLTLKESGG
jgi:general secretion pathway protein M